MKRLFNTFLFAIMLVFIAPIFVFAETEKPKPVLKSHKLTGTVVSNDKRYVSACILDDKILWEGRTYLVVDGKIKHEFIPSKNVKLRDGEKLAKVVKIENSVVTVECEGKTQVFKARK